MTKFTAKPERTYGLIVGIEEYLEKAWNVNGQVNDAIEFAAWLLSRGVPKENIRLCLSPLNENSELVKKYNFTPEPATEQNLFEIITNEMSRKSGDLLFIFFAGHGLITSERNRRLICADATKKNWQNLDLNSLLLLLGSDSFEICHQICIIDACANYVLESFGRPTNLGRKEFPSGQPRKESQQFVLLATREGETAKVNSKEKTGYFSQVVREVLRQEVSEDWPPDMQVVADKVKQRFETLDKQQKPTYFYRRSWDGDVLEKQELEKDLAENRNKLSFAQRLKKESLEERLAVLEKDYKVLGRDHREAGDSDTKCRLQSKLDRKLEEIEEITQELNQINHGE